MPALLSLRHYHQDTLCHEHDHAQLVFGLSGHLEFEVAGFGSRVARQTLAIVPRGARHACDSRHGSECLVLDVPDDAWLGRHMGERSLTSHELLDTPCTLALSASQNGLVSWLAASRLEDPLIAHHGALLLLASLGEAASVPGGLLPMARLDAYIERHAARRLQVADLAKIANLSVTRLHNRFVNQTGLTPMAYVRERRLRLGRQLLHTSRLSVGEIAVRVGYSSQSAFTAALSRHFGETPSMLRQSCDK